MLIRISHALYTLHSTQYKIFKYTVFDNIINGGRSTAKDIKYYHDHN